MHIVYVGYPGFPFGYAQVERQKLLSKGLITYGCDVTVINRYGVFNKQKHMGFPTSGTFEGIRYVYTSGITYRPEGIFKRNYFKLKGLYYELNLIWKSKLKGNLDAIIITTNSFYNVILYACIAYFCNVSSILDNVEYWSSRKETKFWKRLDNYLYDKYSYKCVSKVLCISDFLLQVVRTGSPTKPAIKIPTIVDFSNFTYKSSSQDPFFLFCGSAVYIEIIDFILEAYESLGQTTYKLYIVSSGSPEQIATLKQRIEQSPLKGSVKHLADLSYDDLIKLYTSSRALLIPLLNRQQDIARFPHKFGEYCASGKVIITTNVGEVKSYFKDKVNALIADIPTTRCFAEKMNFVIKYPELVESIGGCSYMVGKVHFDHNQLGKRVFDFLNYKKIQK